MRTRTPAAVTGIGLVIAVTIGVFASASFATQGLVSRQGDVITDDVRPMDDLRTHGSVKAFERKGTSGYSLDFTATFTPAPGGDNQLTRVDERVPDLTMVQSMSYPTLSDQQEFVGPVRLPFASQTLRLQVKMSGECFEAVGKNGGYRLQGFEPKCTEAWLSLGDQSFNVSDLFIDVDSRLKAVGRDGKRWMWRATATFEDPGYGFPIVSLGQGGSTTVVVGDMGGVTSTGKVKFDSE